jgi:hypothetical protein
MTLGEILDRTIQIYRSRFLVFIGIAAIPALAMLALHWRDRPFRPLCCLSTMISGYGKRATTSSG